MHPTSQLKGYCVSMHIDVSVACSIKPPKCTNITSNLPSEAAFVIPAKLLLSHSCDAEQRMCQEAAGCQSREAYDKLGRENVKDPDFTV